MFIRTHTHQNTHNAGFTLVELAIVLVIIGLIIGSVLAGQDLIEAAEIRAQISQIEKYNTAVNTFRVKYGELPGDLTANSALALGFATRTGDAGQGDNDGTIEGTVNGYGASGLLFAGGEALLLWEDLSSANLIEGNFSASDTLSDTGIADADLPKYFPQAKVRGNYVEAWSGSYDGSGGPSNLWGINFFTIAIPNLKVDRQPVNTTGLTVNEAYNIDLKIDDGLPQTGRVVALYPNDCDAHGNYAYWSTLSHTNPADDTCGMTDFVNRTQVFPNTTPTPASDVSCYDNGNVSGISQQYTMAKNNGSGINCALSFRFQ